MICFKNLRVFADKTFLFSVAIVLFDLTGTSQ
jgi:hypothetical protein